MLMLLCFGAAWPFSIIKSYKSRKNAGKSILFLAVIMAGYVSGIIHKLLHSYDAVVYLYAINALMVGIDIVLYARNSRIRDA